MYDAPLTLPSISTETLKQETIALQKQLHDAQSDIAAQKQRHEAAASSLLSQLQDGEQLAAERLHLQSQAARQQTQIARFGQLPERVWHFEIKRQPAAEFSLRVTDDETMGCICLCVLMCGRSAWRKAIGTLRLS